MNRLDKYIKQIRGISYNPKDISEIPLEDYLPILKANNIQESSLDISNLIYIHKSRIKQEQLIKKGDLLLAASSGSKDIVGKNIFFENDFNGSFGAFCKVVRPNKDIIPEFLSVFFKTPIYKRHIKNLIQGANINNLRNEDIDSLKIPDFALNDQIYIANIISKADNLIKQRKETIKLLDEFLKSTFLDMFGDPVRNEKKWDRVQLVKLGSLDRGVSKTRPRNLPELLGGMYPLIQTGEVTNSGLYITKYTRTYSELGLNQSKLWKKGTMLITIAANIAQTSILTFDACFPDSIVGFCIKENEANTIYVHFLFKFFQKILEKNAPQAAQKNINLALLRNLLVPKPSLELQNEFALIVDKVEALRKDYENSLQELEKLYGSLSQKAFKGDFIFKDSEKDVIELENGEIEAKEGFREMYYDEKTIPFVEKIEKPRRTQVGKATLENFYEKDISRIIKQYFTGFDFRFIDLIKLLEEEKAIAVSYNTTEELKRFRGESDEIKDLQTFIFDCVQGKCKHLKLKQWFHDAYNDFDLKKITIRADKEEIRRKLLGSPPEMNIEEFHGIYFKIIG